jgi:NAD(P)H-dependent flavin oxidoreductase YrpB (nitropropane dioxygenase family)
MIETRITDAFGLSTPILSAGMAFVSRPKLAAAVSNAGGMGFLGADMTPPDAVAEMVAATRRLTSRPFGIDFMVPFFTEEHLQACLASPVAAVTFIWGYPNWEWVEKLQEVGSKVWMKVTSLEEAKGALQCGLDGLVVEAPQGGPGRGSPSLMSLLPAVVDAVHLPVIASGSIVDGRGLAASLTLGAEAVRCGTRFLAATEADAQSEYDRRFGPSAIDGTMLVDLFSREWPEDPVQAVENQTARRWAYREIEVKAAAVGSQPRPEGSCDGHTALTNLAEFLLPGTGEGSTTNAISQNETAQASRSVQPAAQIMNEMTREAERILSRTRRLVAVA